jgi:pimeloyl-ACP methyl ester carboxylesterase
VAGLWTYRSQKPPYTQIRALHRRYFQEPVYPEYSKVREDHWEKNVEQMLSFKTMSDVESKRRELIDYVWKGEGFPTSSELSEIETDIQDRRYTDLGNLDSIDKYVLTMRHSVNSIVYHFHPESGNGRLMIYHQGHKGDFVIEKETIRFFLDRGFTILAFAMPLRGMNSRPVVDLGNLGLVRLFDHTGFKYIETPEFSCMRYYLDPIAMVLNYVEERYQHDSISMVGHSGGGATTILYAAIDPRVGRSYPINTVLLPLFLRKIVGDYEKSRPDFYRIANALELYAMGASGEGRKQMQIFNLHDPRGENGARTWAYKEKVSRVVAQLSAGEFDVYLDPENMKHVVGTHGRQAVLDDVMGDG